MSFTHGVLKKTEGGQALTAQPRADWQGDPGKIERAVGKGTEFEIAGALEHLESEEALTVTGWLRLEELRQRCAKPEWKFNPDYAVFFARAIVRQHERRALLIDADLRASRLHVRMGAPSRPGLADYLCGEADESSIIQAGGKEDLYFIPAGRPVSNPAELLGSARLKPLLDRLAPVFDWIVLDAPPVLAVSDAGILAGLCDGVIFVIRAGVTPHDAAQAACQELKENNLLGVVLNGADASAMYGAYSYYSGNGMDKR